MYLDDSIEDYDDEDLIPTNRKQPPAIQSSPRKNKTPAWPVVVTPVAITEFTPESDPSMLYGKLRTRREEVSMPLPSGRGPSDAMILDG